MEDGGASGEKQGGRQGRGRAQQVPALVELGRLGEGKRGPVGVDPGAAHREGCVLPRWRRALWRA